MLSVQCEKGHQVTDRIILVSVWVITAGIAVGPALIAAIRVLHWSKYTGMRALLFFFIGTTFYSCIALYLAISFMFSRPVAELTAYLLTFGQLAMLLPATIFAYQVLWVFASKPPEQSKGGDEARQDG